MSNHTPEPWSKNAISPTVYDGDGIAILRCEGRTLIAENEANARRIVACVNACRGLSTKDLEENGLVSAVGYELLNLDAQLAAVTTQHGGHSCSDRLLQQLKDAKIELNSVLVDWNAIVSASGSKTHGGAVGHVAQMRAELEAVKAERDELKAELKATESRLHEVAVGCANAEFELEAAKENHRIHAARLISEKILVSEHLEAARKQEPCGWQCRFITPTETWGYCSKEHYETVKAAPHEYPGYEVRALYARPVPAQQPMPWPDQRPDFAGGG